MVEANKRIAIVGCGFSGIGSIAALKEEGHEPVCFEASEKIGGTWCYREDSSVGYASIMPTTVSNNSKEIGAVSDFPPPKEFSTFMRHKELLQYATSYLKQKDCEKYIHFNSEVIHVKKAEDYDETGRYLVTVKDKVKGEISTDVFDGVIIGTGHFTYPKMATFQGQEKFKGTIIHTHSLKQVREFKGQNVLVVGSGCSGFNAADAISPVAKNVYLSTRSGSFVLSRQGPSGYPLDYVLLRRYIAWLIQVLPINWCSWYIETFYVDTKFDHQLYNVPPKYHVLSKDPVFNDGMASRLLAGSVRQKGGVKYLTEDSAMFDGEDSLTQVDSIVLATGYDFKYPFLEEGLLEIEDGRIGLYKCIFPSHLPHWTLAFIGMINPYGPGLPVAEMQCRYAAQIFSGKCKLPSNQEMLEDVIKRHQSNEKRYAPSSLQSIRVDFLPYMDDLASEIGAKPNLIKYMFRDFPLFLRLLFGPSLPYQYRLEGPHKWDGAREAIITSRERILYPLVMKRDPKKETLQFIWEFIGNVIPRNIFNY